VRFAGAIPIFACAKLLKRCSFGGFFFVLIGTGSDVKTQDTHKLAISANAWSELCCVNKDRKVAKHFSDSPTSRQVNFLRKTLRVYMRPIKRLPHALSRSTLSARKWILTKLTNDRCSMWQSTPVGRSYPIDVYC
jgi:hypothetical protein